MNARLQHAYLLQKAHYFGHYHGWPADENLGVLESFQVLAQQPCIHVPYFTGLFRLVRQHMEDSQGGHGRGHLFQLAFEGDIFFHFVAPDQDHVPFQILLFYISKYADEGGDTDTPGNENQVRRVIIEEAEGTVRHIDVGSIGAGEACVCHLETVFGYGQAYISQQLIALREAGLVDSRRNGKYFLTIKKNQKIWNCCKTLHK